MALGADHAADRKHPTEAVQDRDADVHPSGSLATTIPLPARAEKRNPALNTVKIAKPLAFSRMLRGIT